MRRNTGPVGEVNSPLGWRKVLLSTGIDRPRCQKLSGLGLDQHQKVPQLFGSKLHGHVADDVSRSRKYHWGNVERVSSKRPVSVRTRQWRIDSYEWQLPPQAVKKRIRE